MSEQAPGAMRANLRWRKASTPAVQPDETPAAPGGMRANLRVPLKQFVQRFNDALAFVKEQGEK